MTRISQVMVEPDRLVWKDRTRVVLSDDECEWVVSAWTPGDPGYDRQVFSLQRRFPSKREAEEYAVDLRQRQGALVYCDRGHPAHVRSEGCGPCRDEDLSRGERR